MLRRPRSRSRFRSECFPFVLRAVPILLVAVLIGSTAHAQSIVGSLPTNEAFGVDVVGTTAYVADGAAGARLRIIDVSDPAAPTEVGQITTIGDTRAVDVENGFAFVAAGNSGLRVIDVSNPAAPVLVATLTSAQGLNGFAADVLVVGNRAYVAAGTVYVIDVSNPLAPSILGNSGTTSAAALALGADANTIFVAEYPTLVRRLNVSNPASPTTVSTFSTPGDPIEIDAAGNVVYVADLATGLTIVDFSGTPTQLGSYDSPDAGRGVRVSGTMAYLADESTGVLYLDVSDPAAITLQATVNTPGEAWDLIRSGAFLYVADRMGGLQILDLDSTNVGAALAINVLTANPYELSLEYTVENMGSQALGTVSATSSLDAVFGPGNWTLTGGPSFSITPAALALNPNFDGNADPELFGAGTLAAGETARIEITVEVAIPGVYEGQFTVQGASAFGTTSDVSTAGYDPDGVDDDGVPDENLPTPVALESAFVGLALAMDSTPALGVGRVTMTLVAENLGDVDLQVTSLHNDLDAAFGLGNWSLIGATSLDGPLVVNSGYDGRFVPNLAIGTLPVGTSATFEVSIVVATPGTYAHQATIDALSQLLGTLAQDTSTAGTDPDPNGDGVATEATATSVNVENPVLGVAKAMTALPGGSRVQVDFQLENFGDVALSGLSLADDLDAVIGTGAYTMITPPQLVAGAGSVAPNASFDGSSDTSVLSGSLASGASATVRFVVDVAASGIFTNQVTATAVGAFGTVVTDVSTAGTDPDGTDGDGNPDEATPTVLDFRPIGLVASDDLFEERVSLSWNGTTGANYLYRIERDGQLLSLVGSDQLGYQDTTGRPGQTYTYAVSRVDTQGAVLSSAIDSGSRRIFAPTAISASDSLFVDGVRVTWTDESRIEDGYTIYRRDLPDGLFLSLNSVEANVEAYDDRSAVVGVSYEYAVAARVGFDGEIFRAPELAALPTGDTRDVGTRGFVVPPVNVRATDGAWADRVVVTWEDNSGDETGFSIYRDGQFVTSVGPNTVSWEDTDPTGSDGSTHEYCVSSTATLARMADTPVGSTARRAPIESVQVCDQGVGGAGTLAGPSAVTASNALYDDRVELSWELPGAGEDSVLVLRGATVLARLLAPTLTFEDRATLGAVPGTPYTYTIVTKTIEGGTSAATPQTQAIGQLSAVVAPVSVRASDGTRENEVEITWDTTSTTATLFKIYRDGSFIQTVARAPGVGSYRVVDTDVDTAEHTWCVRAVTALGVESPDACDTGRRTILAPTAVRATDREFEHIVRVTWTDVSEIESGYHVVRKLVGADDSTFTQVGGTTANRNVFDDPTAANDVDYVYGVFAVDARSGQSARTIDDGARRLKAPTGLAATDGDHETKVALRWNDPSRREQGYRVYRRIDGSTDPFGLVSPDLPADTFEYDDTTALVLGTVYEYEVRSFDFGGESADPLSRTEGSTEILPPAELNASTGYRIEVVLTWIDRSVANVRYDIERDGVKIGEAGPSATRFSDASPPNVRTEYRVVSVSPEGRRSTPAIAYGSALPLNATTSTLDLSDASRGSVDPLPTISSQLISFDGDQIAWSSDEGWIYASRAAATGEWTTIGLVRWQSATSRAVDTSELVLVTGGGDDSTSVYVGSRRATNNPWCESWGQGGGIPATCEARVLNSPHAPDQRFYGASVGIDKGLIVVGAPERRAGAAGLVDVWLREEIGDPFDGRDWNLETTFDGSAYPGASFGYSVDVDGAIVAIGVPGAPGGGFVRIAERLGPANWITYDITRPAGSIGTFGASVVIEDGRLVVGSTTSPAWDAPVHVFARQALSDWSLESTLLPDDGLSNGGFGYSIDMSAGELVVGQPGWGGATATFAGGRVHRYEALVDGGWAFVGTLRSSVRTISDGLDYEFGRAVALGDGVLAVMSQNNVLIENLDAVSGNGYQVTATDGEADDRIQVRWSNLQDETGFRLLRDGEEIDTLDADILRYDDTSAVPGRVYEYCVIATTPAGDVEVGCDFGRRPPDGKISGRVATFEGAGVRDVQVFIEPSPNRGIMLDGGRGEYVSGRVELQPNFNASPFTVEFWVRGAAPGISGTPFSWEQDAQSGSRAAEPIRVEDLADLRLTVGGETSPSLGIDIADGEWHHVAATWSGRLSAVGQFWIDGVPSDTFVVGLGTGLTPGILHLGQHISEDGSPAFDRALQGEMDEFRFWDIVLTGAQIQSRANQTLTGDEFNLTAYWSFDEASGTAAPDSQERGWYLAARGGAFSTGNGAPAIATSAITDAEGNYVIQASYGESTTFVLTPKAPGRAFTPNFKTIVLSEQSPVQNEVSFTESTSLTLNGTIRFFDEANCVAEGIEIRVNGIAQGQTNDLGEFELVVDYGTNVIRPVAAGREFRPAEIVLNVTESTTGIDFQELTSRLLTINVGGGDCKYPIGTLRLGVVSENGCLPPTFVDVSEQEQLRLPPQKYFVFLEEIVTTNLDRGTLTTWFDRVGSQEIDLTNGNGTLDFLYRAPLQMTIRGFPDLPDGCSATNPVIHLPGGATIPAVPVIDQGESVPLEIEVVEDYGNGNLCVVEKGTVKVYDEVIDEQESPKTLVIENGLAMVEVDGERSSYVTIGNTPNPAAGRRDAQNNDRSFQKAITFIAEVENQRPLTVTEWALVTGHRPRESTFTTVSDGIPLMVLRDPPGDGSSAFLEEGQSFCTTFQTAGLLSRTTGNETKVKGGVEFTAGFGFMTRTDVEATTRGKLSVTMATNLKNQVELCATATERIATSSSSFFVGDDADLFMGVGVNFIFAKTDVLELDGCELVQSEAVAMGAEGFDTVYLYTVGHIRDTVIPALRDLATSNPDRSPQLNRARLNWESHLALNERLKQEAKFERNRSFSAGADFNYSETNTFRDTFSWEVGVEAQKENAVTLGFEAAGSGNETTFETTLKATFSQGGTVDDGTSRTIGYTLADDDQGDFFTVDIKSDGKYGTPVFDLVEGTSSCPYEPGTQPRDRSFLNISPGELVSVSPDSIASLTVSMTNLSDAGEARDYVLVPVQASNPGGAILKLNGESFSGGIGFRIEHNETVEAVLTVERGPTRFTYEDIELNLIPLCSFAGTPKPVDGYSRATFSVSFTAPCTDVTVTRPLPGWIHNAGAAAVDDSLDILLTNFRIDLGGGQPLKRLRATYRANGTGPWLPIAEITDFETDPRIGPDGSASLRWGLNNVPDGRYEIRAEATCDAGIVNSTIVRGIIDRAAPQTVERLPSDGVLTVGESIRADFNEPIDCLTVTKANVRLTNASENVPVLVDLICDASGSIVIVPVNPSLAAMEEDQLRVDVSGVKDVAGNPVAPFNWTFSVQQSAFAWARTGISRQVSLGVPGSVRAVLANGTGADGDFAIDTTGTPFVTAVPASGTLRAGEEIEIRFEYLFDDPLLIGSNPNGSVVATLDSGIGGPLPTSLLDLSLDVECTASDPVAFDPGPYRYSMTIVARLDFGTTGGASEAGDAIVAYVGRQVRGYAVVETVNVSGETRDLAFLTVHGSIPVGEIVRFELIDASQCRRYPGTDRYLSFADDQRLGTPLSPQNFNARLSLDSGAQVIPVSSGWNWISLNVLGDDMSVPFVLGNLNPGDGDQIRSQSGAIAEYATGLGWVGTLVEFDNAQSYQLKIGGAGEIVVPGASLVLPSTVPIPIAQGWNWIGYTPSGPQPLRDALVQLEDGRLVSGDQLRSRTAFASYDEFNTTKAWLGSLVEMRPGIGYRLYLDQSPAIASFTYPQAAGNVPLLADGSPDLAVAQLDSSGTAETVLLPVVDASLARMVDGTAFGLDPRKFEHTMTVTARLDFAGQDRWSESQVLVATVDGEVRGFASPTPIAALQDHRVFLMLYSNEPRGETVALQIVDTVDDVAWASQTTVDFVADAAAGRVLDPFLVVAGERTDPTRIAPARFQFLRPYPNPFGGRAGATTIRYGLPSTSRVRVSLYDLRGRRIGVLVDDEQPAGWHEVPFDARELGNGTYLCRIEAAGWTGVQKLTVVK